MLKVCFQAITTGQKIWSRFPAPRQTIREMSGQLGMNAAKIVEVESDGSVFAPYLIGKEVPPEKGYKEVDFLERRMECLTRKEQQVFQEALEMEHPETLEEMVNLSCNLDKFELLEETYNILLNISRGKIERISGYYTEINDDIRVHRSNMVKLSMYARPNDKVKYIGFAGAWMRLMGSNNFDMLCQDRRVIAAIKNCDWSYRSIIETIDIIRGVY